MNTGLRLLGEDFQPLKWIDARTRLTMLAEGVADKVYRAKDGTLSTDAAVGRTDGSIKIRTRPSSDIGSDLPTTGESKCVLTLGDMLRYAGGLIDTPKRKLVYEARKKGNNIPAYLRVHGRDAEGKQRESILGNLVDVSMSRVEHWSSASELNNSVTIVHGAIIGITKRELDPQSSFAI